MTLSVWVALESLSEAMAPRKREKSEFPTFLSVSLLKFTMPLWFPVLFLLKDD